VVDRQGTLKRRNRLAKDHISHEDREAFRAADRNWDRLHAGLAELLTDWVWESDADHRIVYVSERLRTIMGVDPAFFIGKLRTEYVEESAEPEALEAHLEDLKSGRPFRDFVYSTNTPSGLRYVRISGNPVFDCDGAFAGYRGIGADITDRIAAEQRAERNNQALVDAVESLNVGFAQFDSDDRLVLWNTAYMKLYPEIADRLVPGMHFREILYATAERKIIPQEAGRVDEWVEQTLRERTAGRAPFEFQIPDGRWMLVSDHRTSLGGVISLHADITEMKQREEAQRQSERRFAVSFDFSPGMTAIADIDDGTLIDVNEKWLTAYGWSRDEVIGKSVLELGIWLEPADRKRFIDLLMANGSVRDFETRHKTKSGGILDVIVAGEIVPVDGKPRLLVAGYDITDRKRAEVAILAAKEEAELASRAKSEFLANMSHELRTPLNAILGFSQIIRDGVLGPVGNEKYTEYADDIMSSGQHLLDIISDILDLSRIDAGQATLEFEEVDLRDIVDACLSLVRERADSAGVSLKADYGKSILGLSVDKRKLKQILINLLSNAVKFTHRGGSVTVEVALKKNGYLTIVVRDTGIGIEPADIPAVFEHFSQLEKLLTREHEGTGLGLPLARSLCELHGGTLELTSKKGKGTVATVCFPPERVLRERQRVVGKRSGTG
jgi:PAS domain S-box-containing protein